MSGLDVLGVIVLILVTGFFGALLLHPVLHEWQDPPRKPRQ